MGAELRKLRERAGLTQEQLSFRADLSRGIWPRERTLLDLYFEARF